MPSRRGTVAANTNAGRPKRTRVTGTSGTTPPASDTGGTATGGGVPIGDGDYIKIDRNATKPDQGSHINIPKGTLQFIGTLVISVITTVAIVSWNARGLYETMSEIQTNVRTIKEKIDAIGNDIWKANDRLDQINNKFYQNDKPVRKP